jgi:cysteine-rich repeat protein/parallel beta-helix repeat protein
MVSMLLAAQLLVPADFATIQEALGQAGPGDRVVVSAGVYNEKINFVSGGVPGAFVSLEAAAGARPILDGSGVAGANMVLIESKSYVRIKGFEIRNNLGVNDGSGVRVIGHGSHIEILDNTIHDMRGNHAMGITVYGTDNQPISDLVIDGNSIYDCEPANSEALVLNGNVSGFTVSNNLIRDVNNIGIDFIGGETDVQPDPGLVARNGLCSGNTVVRARSNYGGGWAAGIYVDGGRDIVIENNTVSGSDMGIEVGAENAATIATGIIVRNNLIYANDKACLVFGGYAASVGRADGNLFSGNTCHGNDLSGSGVGELWIQWAENNMVVNNIFAAVSGGVALYAEESLVGNTLDFNLWHSQSGQAEFTWQGQWYESFGHYRQQSGQGQSSFFADPLFVDPDSLDFHLQPSSPAIDGGDPGPDYGGQTDLDRASRLWGARVDIGVDEYGSGGCGNGVVDAVEQCDDGNAVEGDGCDSNCTLSACGNGIKSPDEDCDDGNNGAGDCCSAACSYEAVGSACDDGRGCTPADSCDGQGVCSGDQTPRSGCLLPVKPAASLLLIKDSWADRRDKLLWKWSKGQATELSMLGDPRWQGGYDLCVYGTSAEAPLVYEAAIKGGGICRGRACWKAIGGPALEKIRGFKYRDRLAQSQGVKKLLVKTGSVGKARITLLAKGQHLSVPVLPLVQSPALVVQMVSSAGACWEAVYSGPALASGPVIFKDKSD